MMFARGTMFKCSDSSQVVIFIDEIIGREHRVRYPNEGYEFFNYFNIKDFSINMYKFYTDIFNED